MDDRKESSCCIGYNDYVVATFSSGFEERTSTSVSCEARTSLWPSRSLTVSYSNFPANSIKADT